MLHKRCLRIIYNDKQSLFNELLNKNSSVSVHIENIQRLATEMLKFCNGLLPPIMDNVFKLKTKNPYNLRQVSEFSRPIVKAVYHGIESISCLGNMNMAYMGYIYTARKTKEHEKSRKF